MTAQQISGNPTSVRDGRRRPIRQIDETHPIPGMPLGSSYYGPVPSEGVWASPLPWSRDGVGWDAPLRLSYDPPTFGAHI